MPPKFLKKALHFKIYDYNYHEWRNFMPILDFGEDSEEKWQTKYTLSELQNYLSCNSRENNFLMKTDNRIKENVCIYIDNNNKFVFEIEYKQCPYDRNIEVNEIGRIKINGNALKEYYYDIE
jgi:hypothetical protein